MDLKAQANNLVPSLEDEKGASIDFCSISYENLNLLPVIPI